MEEMAYEIGPMHRVFLDNIRERREQLGLTQAAVADRMDISQSSYAQIEIGRRTPTIEMVERVAKALRCKAMELLDNKRLAKN